MQTYYELGYVHALEKLGMLNKRARGEGAVQMIKGLLGSGARQGRQVARAYEGGAKRMVMPGGRGAAPTIDLAGQGSLTQALKAGKKVPRMEVPMSGHSYAAPEQIANMPSGAEAFGMPGVKGTRIGKLEGPIMSQQGLGPATSGGAPRGKTKAPVVESSRTPKAKAAPTAATGRAAAETPASQGLLSKYKWPILGGVGLAGLGGYAYLNNRDPMGEYPVRGY